jgi:hypothetical protein
MCVSPLLVSEILDVDADDRSVDGIVFVRFRRWLRGGGSWGGAANRDVMVAGDQVAADTSTHVDVLLRVAHPSS